MKNIFIACFTLFSLQFSAQQNVGIGTNSPEMKLHVTEADSTVLLLENSQTLQNKTSNGLYFKTGLGPIPYTGAIKTIGESSSSARLGLFTFTSNSTTGLKERLSITDVGTVGIGTTNPLRDLHVSAPREELLLLENTLDLEVDASNAIIFKTGKAVKSFTGAIKTIGTSTAEARLGLFTFTGVSSAGLQERLSILDNGDVGIGTIIPESKLQVSKADSTLLVLENTEALAKNRSNAMYFKTGSGARPFTGAIKTIGENTQAARLGLFTYASETKEELSERLSITDSGNVGIGTTNPLMRFHVKHLLGDLLVLENDNTLNTGITSAMYFKTGDGALPFTGGIKTIGQNTSAARLGFFTFAAATSQELLERMSINDNGDVGIGTTEPESRFHLNGKFRLVDGTEGAGKVLVSDVNGVATWKNPPLTCNLDIGDTHEGGIIFYLDGSGCHGLVAKATDEPDSLKWALAVGNDGGLGVGLYEGEHNTNKIVSLNNSGNAPAAEACRNSTTNGKDDWYLPSRIELDMMFVNLKLASLGNFANAFYWSSSESNNLSAWNQNFTDGFQDNLPFNKLQRNRVRAIRAF